METAQDMAVMVAVMTHRHAQGEGGTSPCVNPPHGEPVEPRGGRYRVAAKSGMFDELISVVRRENLCLTDSGCSLWEWAIHEFAD